MIAKTTTLILGLLLFVPMALAQNATSGDKEDGGDTNVFVNPPDDIDVNIEDNDDPEESVGPGWGTTTILIVVVVAALLVALIVGMASRDRW